MKAEVIEIFQDKFTNELHEVGTTVDFDSARIDDLSKRGLVKVLEEKKPARKVTKKNQE